MGKGSVVLRRGAGPNGLHGGDLALELLNGVVNARHGKACDPSLRRSWVVIASWKFHEEADVVASRHGLSEDVAWPVVIMSRGQSADVLYLDRRLEVMARRSDALLLKLVKVHPDQLRSRDESNLKPRGAKL
jgi:hypothetical protein